MMSIGGGSHHIARSPLPGGNSNSIGLTNFGTAEVTCNDKVYLLTEDIPLGNRHRLVNPGTIPLEIIEVQSGSYLGEDDIVRFDDVSGR